MHGSMEASALAFLGCREKECTQMPKDKTQRSVLLKAIMVLSGKTRDQAELTGAVGDIAGSQHILLGLTQERK